MTGMTRHGEQGSLFIIIPVSLVIAIGLVVSTLMLSTSNMTTADRETRRIQAYYVAKAGVERQIFDLKQLTEIAALTEPFQGVDQLHGSRTYDGESLLMGDDFIGDYEVSLRIEGMPLDGSSPGPMSNSTRFVTLRSTGFVPNRADPDAVQHTIETTVLLELSSSEVFDYAYFINNWGYYFGDSIRTEGNVRSNGQFAAGDTQLGVYYSPTIEGTPRYIGANGADLYGYQDDNSDGIADGSDGGVYAGWDILGASQLQGMSSVQQGSTYVNQHDYSGHVGMPNLTDLSIYEEHAISAGSSISIGGSQMCDAVFGDDPGESGHIVLIGTAADPIEINGVVVIRGSIIIKGIVSGQGVIYSGGNVYVAGDVTYDNPPTSPRPASGSEADFQTWLNQNQGADALGLFAREHVLLGDPSHFYFQYYVNNWLNHPSNTSSEDNGEDGIPNTLAGLDGVMGSVDDDVLEGNSVFDVEYYTQSQANSGLIPSGFSVGDVIPGTGEDIDGDGSYDSTVTLSDFDLPTPLNSGQWGGNLPSGTTQLGQIASIYVSHFDAAMYTNHTMAGVLLNYGGQIQINGCVVSRNESIIYGANEFVLNHDARLMGGGDNFGYYLPRSFKNLRVMKVRDDAPNIHFDEIMAEHQSGGSNP